MLKINYEEKIRATRVPWNKSVIMTVLAITVTRVVVGLTGVITGGGYFETVNAFIPPGASMPALIIGFIASFMTTHADGRTPQGGSN